jgi:sigma-B regulation protein RsbU (phosphoserine phosphatase)
VERLNAQIVRHSPPSRFITLFYGEYEQLTGTLTYVNAGQNPPLIRRRNGTYDRLGTTGVALGMFEASRFTAATTRIAPGDLLVLFSDGITEAENPSGQPLEDTGLELVLERYGALPPAELGARILAAVENHANASRFADDLTILLLKRAAVG